MKICAKLHTSIELGDKMMETQRNFECVEPEGHTMLSFGFNQAEVRKECANCCTSLTPASTSLESEDVLLDMTGVNFNGSVISVKTVLCEIFKLGDLTALGEDEDPLPEIIPLCPSCISILADLYKLYDMFRSLRKMESFVSAKIGRLDEIIRRNASKDIGNRVDVVVSEVASAAADEIKEEPLDYDCDDLNASMSSPEAEELERRIVFPEKGPWVKLVRLRPEDIPNARFLPSEPSRRNGAEADISSSEVVNVGGPDSGVRRSSRRKALENDIVVIEEPKCNSPTARVMKKPGISKETTKRKVRKTWATKSNRDQLPKQSTSSKDRVLHNKKNSAKKLKSMSTTKKTIKSDTNDSEGTHNNTNTATSSYGKINVLSEFWTDFLRRKDKFPFPCFHCKEDFHSETERLDHMKNVHQEYEFPCSVCGKGFKSKQGYTEHFPRCGHLPDNVHLPPYICDTCGKEFPKYHLLYVHKKTIHIPATIPCDECNFKARTKNFLRAHKEGVHPKEPPVKCHVCDKVCRTQYLFKQHFRTKHTEEGHKKYKLSVAKKAEKLRAKRHAAYAAAAARFTTSVCQYCHVDFQTITRVRRHTLNVHEFHRKTNICELCGKGFINADKLKRHQTAAHSDARPFVCDICGRCYKTRDNLTMHNRITHDEEGKRKYNEYMRHSSKLRAKIAQSRASSSIVGQTSSENARDDSEVDGGNTGRSQASLNNGNSGYVATTGTQQRGQEVSTASSEDGSGGSGTGVPAWNPLPLLLFHNS